jgi:uncharacterized protein (DUF433 family)
MIKIARRHERIAARPEVMGGKPCIKGTRIPADLILRHLADGQSSEERVEAFLGLTAAGRGGLGMPTNRVSSAPRQRGPETAVSLPSMIRK